jgi:hypothetical protein
MDRVLVLAGNAEQAVVALVASQGRDAEPDRETARKRLANSETRLRRFQERSK